MSSQVPTGQYCEPALQGKITARAVSWNRARQTAGQHLFHAGTKRRQIRVSAPASSAVAPETHCGSGCGLIYAGIALLGLKRQCLGAGVLQTIYDWVTVAIFGALIVLFLHRSTAQEEPKDNILQYLPACIGCALANYVGNQGHGAIAFAIVVVVLVYIAYVLKPFNLKF